MLSYQNLTIYITFSVQNLVNEADQEAKEEALRAKQHRPGMIVTPVEETPPASKQITELLQILEFNQIDMYRYVMIFHIYFLKIVTRNFN